MTRLQLAVLAQALEDALRGDLNRPLTGLDLAAEPEYEYFYADALRLLGRHPKLMKRLVSGAKRDKAIWLSNLERVLNEQD